MATQSEKQKLQRLMNGEGLEQCDLEALMNRKVTDSPQDVKAAIAFLESKIAGAGKHTETIPEPYPKGATSGHNNRDYGMPSSGFNVALCNIRSEGNVRLEAIPLAELYNSMALIGLMNPISCYKEPGSWVVVDGHRRLAAARELQWEYIRVCQVQRPANQARLAMWQMLNNSGEPLSPIEEATAIARILEIETSLNQHELAARLGKTQPWISQRLALLKLPEPVRAAVESGEIPAGVGLEIKEAPELLDEARGKSQKDVRKLVKPPLPIIPAPESMDLDSSVLVEKEPNGPSLSELEDDLDAVTKAVTNHTKKVSKSVEETIAEIAEEKEAVLTAPKAGLSEAEQVALVDAAIAAEEKNLGTKTDKRPYREAVISAAVKSEAVKHPEEIVRGLLLTELSDMGLEKAPILWSALKEWAPGVAKRIVEAIR